MHQGLGARDSRGSPTWVPNCRQAHRVNTLAHCVCTSQKLLSGLAARCKHNCLLSCTVPLWVQEVECVLRCYQKRAVHCIARLRMDAENVFLCLCEAAQYHVSHEIMALTQFSYVCTGPAFCGGDWLPIVLCGGAVSCSACAVALAIYVSAIECQACSCVRTQT